MRAQIARPTDEIDHDAEERFARNLARFHGRPDPLTGRDLDLGGTGRTDALESRLLAELEALERGNFAGPATTDTSFATHGPRFDPHADPLPELEPVPSSPLTRAYDKLFLRRRAVEAALERLTPTDPRSALLRAELEALGRKIRTELDRGTDDDWRERRATDYWRETEGRDEYNRSRRKVRAKANRPDASNEDERLDRDAERKRKARASMTETERAVARERDAARKRAKRQTAR